MVTDGLEAEYGPVPDFDPNIVDWVVLYRLERGYALTRPPTKAELKIFDTGVMWYV